MIELLGMFLWTKEVIFRVSENATFFKKIGVWERGGDGKDLKNKSYLSFKILFW